MKKKGLGPKYCPSIKWRPTYWRGLLKGVWSANVHWNVISQIRTFIFGPLLHRQGGFFRPSIDWQTKDERACAGIYCSSTVCSEQTRQSDLLPASAMPWHSCLSSSWAGKGTICLSAHHLFWASLALLPHELLIIIPNNRVMLALACPTGLFLGSR